MAVLAALAGVAVLAAGGAFGRVTSSTTGIGPIVTVADAQNAASRHVPADATFSSAVDGPFGVVFKSLGSQQSDSSDIAPTAHVWVVTFDRQVVICPPDGST